MKSDKDPRHIARIAAIQKLFADHFKIDSKHKKEADPLNLYLSAKQKIDKALYKKLYKETEKNLEEIDTILKKFTPQWPFNLIKKVDLEILRVAIYEGFVGKITPVKVTIDEAIELAKEFTGESSSKFISGVLGGIHDSNKRKKAK